MQKWWSLLFGAVLGASFLLFLVSPFIPSWWLPRNVASFGWEIDYLFYVILAFTGFFFVLTEAILVWAMYRYAYRPGQKAVYVEGNHRLEVAWLSVGVVELGNSVGVATPLNRAVRDILALHANGRAAGAA